MVKKREKLNSIIIISVFSILYFYLSSFIRIDILNDVGVRYKYTERYAVFFAFPLVGYGLSLLRNGEKILAAGITAGMILYLLFFTDMVSWQNALAGKREDFGIINAQHSASVFLLLSFVAYYLYASTSKLLGGVLLLLFTSLFIAGQVRAIWLGLFLYLTLLALFFIKTNIKKLSAKTVVAFSIVLLVGMVAVFYGSSLAEHEESQDASRFSLTSKDFKSFFDYVEKDEITPSSSVVRVVSWVKGSKWALERPIFGHGPGKVKQFIEQDKIFTDTFKGNFQHLHNTYLEVFVSYGVVGVLLYLAAIFLLLKRILLKYREKINSNKTSVFVGAAFIFVWAVANFFESYILYASGWYINLLLFGYLYYLAYLKEIR